MTSIDHAAEARKILARSVSFNEPDASELSADLAALGHATLALVEQQRIANIIALGQVRAGDESLPFRRLIMVPVNRFDVGPTDDIKKGLGL